MLSDWDSGKIVDIMCRTGHDHGRKRKMEQLKILIADGNDAFRTELCQVLHSLYSLRTCRDGVEAMQQLESFAPDVLVLDLMLPGMDGISLLRCMERLPRHPRVLATTRFISDYVADALEHLQVGYVMVKPCDIHALAARIADLSRRSLPCPHRTGRPDTASHLLLTLGVPTKRKGYRCLREALLLKQRDPGQSITKELYPAVAAVCGSSALRVERAIRCAIEDAWERRNETVWQLYFPVQTGATHRRPTNAAFISRLADCIAVQEEISG